MPTDLLDDVIDAAPPAQIRDPLDQLFDDVPDYAPTPKRYLPAALSGPPDPPPLTTGQRLLTAPLELMRSGAQIGQRTVRNVRDLVSASGDLLSANPEAGGYPLQPNNTVTPPPTPDQIRHFTKASETPLVPISAGTKPGTALHGIASGVESLTSPQNLAIVAGSMATAGIPAASMRVLHTGLGAYFTYQMGKGAAQNVKDAYAAYQKNDLDTVAEKLGAGSVEGLMAVFGAVDTAHGIKAREAELSDAIDRHNEDAGLAVATDAISADEPEPEPPGIKPASGAPKGKAPVNIVNSPPPPPKPSNVERISPDTPNPPTAAHATVPESAATIEQQMQDLGSGIRKVVMVPKGTEWSGTYPTGTKVTSDAFGNTYVYRDDLTTRRDIKRAAKNNTLPSLLGSTDLGMGAPDKSLIQGDPITVAGHAADGTEVQSTATDEAHLTTTLAATQKVTPPGGAVSIVPPEQVLAERQPNPAPTGIIPGDLAAPAGLEDPSPAAPAPEPLSAPRGWGAVEPPPYTRHPSVDLSDEELSQRLQNTPLPAPPGMPENAQHAWDTVSRLVPELAGLVKGIRPLTNRVGGPEWGPENASVDVHTGIIRVPPDRPLMPETLWHELIHLDQPETKAGRNALDPDAFNALEIQARAGIKESLARAAALEKTAPSPARQLEIAAPQTRFMQEMVSAFSPKISQLEQWSEQESHQPNREGLLYPAVKKVLAPAREFLGKFPLADPAVRSQLQNIIDRGEAILKTPGAEPVAAKPPVASSALDDLLDQVPPANVAAPDPSAEKGDIATYFRHIDPALAGHPKEALAWVRGGEGRFVPGAIPNPAIEGGVGLLHGFRGAGAPDWKRGFGVSHIDAKREGYLDQAINVIPLLPLVETITDNKTGRVTGKVLSDGKHRAVVSLDWYRTDTPAWFAYKLL